MSSGLNAFLAESFRKNREKTALIQHEKNGKGRCITYEGLAALASQFGAPLSDCATHGRSLGVFMRRSIDHVAAILGALSAGVTYFSINPMMSGLQVAEMIRIANTGLVLCDNSTLLKLTGISGQDLARCKIIHLHEGPLSTVFQSALDKISKVADIETISLRQEVVGALDGSRAPSPDSGRLILFTSGSTGSPRGVLIGDDDLLKRIQAEADAYRISDTDTLLGMLPFSFDVGCNQLFTSLAKGSRLVLLNSWMPADILNAIEVHGVTGVCGVPTLWESVLEADEEKVRQALARLRYITISGGDMAETRRVRLRQLGPKLDIYKTYGQSETFRSGMLMPDEFDRRRGSVGRPPPGVKVFVLTPDGHKAREDEVGEIVHEGTGTMLGYVADPEATARKIRRHPFPGGGSAGFAVFTGDRGKQDRDGYLYVLGRMDRMIKIRGNRVYPEEIEQQLLTHPDISEAVVFLSGAAGNQRLLAGICLKSNKTSSKDISVYLAQRLPTFMLPDRIEVVDSLPRTATGKVDLQKATKLIDQQHASIG